MNVTSVYFSPTGTTKRNVESISNSLDSKAHNIDISNFNSVKEDISLKDQDIVVFGIPVYGGRIWEGAVKRIKHFKGESSPCVLVATYGNRDFDDALIELSDTVKENGFTPITAAAVVGEHTYGTIQVGRPDEKDLMEDSDFAKKILKNFNSGISSEIEVPVNRPYKKGATT